VSLQTLLACDKVPAQAKDAIRQGFEAMREGLIGSTMTADVKRAAAASCKAADDGIRQAGTAMGCP
jgi:hypothetical protein